MTHVSNWVGSAGLALILGESEADAVLLAATPDFPEPVAALAMGMVWRTDDVEAWAAATGREVHH